MKAKILLLALAIMGSSLAFAQPVNHDNVTKCEKKILKKIKRKMTNLHVKEYILEGQRTSFVVTCFLNEDKVVEVARIDGTNEELKQAVIETFKKYPVTCDSEATGNYFTFKIAFEHQPR